MRTKRAVSLEKALCTSQRAREAVHRAENYIVCVVDLVKGAVPAGDKPDSQAVAPLRQVEGWRRGSTCSGIEPIVKIVLLDEAQRRFEAEDRWWRHNRDAKVLAASEDPTCSRRLTRT